MSRSEMKERVSSQERVYLCFCLGSRRFLTTGVFPFQPNDIMYAGKVPAAFLSPGNMLGLLRLL